ncbi:lanthionine synthetase C-like protein [Sorangium cellulosum]|uniref:Lanthionine synthetase C-like protein n=1 Tax=Sorangium cellulosum TaxID=56 RepID=A0A4P2Q1S6_SORCE|nr:LanC-like protein [Sorangium cellulosum]AUX22793.1 lanthionine synthetase C-like protein [Sorangium cellulosum]
MTALFDRDRHEPLAGPVWDAGAARAAMERIVEDARKAFAPDGLWPIHPADAEDGESGPLTSLYFGAAGVVWALDHLAREGAVGPGPTFAEHLADIEVRNRQFLESEPLRVALGAGWQTRSWLLGDAGVFFTRWKAAAEEAVLPALAEVIARNTHDPALELMWGAPGTMLPALSLHRSTGAACWADLYRAGARALEGSLAHDERLGADVWTQDLYGSRVRYLGAVHGLAGNACALIAGRELLDPGAWRSLSSRLARTLEASAIRGASGVNWPAFVDQPPDRPLLVQHCHGAPGMVTALAALDQPIDELLNGGGELTWAAGPLVKGANLCHGTAGNGFAFLKLFERTGDDRWLARARAFAMHAVRQSEAQAEELGRRRYSLWTGDLGLACFLWECVRASARFPTVDVL